MVTLADIPQHKACRVMVASSENPELQGRLYALGLYPGVRVDVLRMAPAGDPIQIRIGTSLLSIRRREATAISVEAL